MCFFHDYDYTCSIYEVSEGPSPKDQKCGECWKKILKGQWCRTVYTQEYELCSECDNKDPECEHSYGETFNYASCEKCERLRNAIREIENAEGCTGDEAEPSLGGLYEEIGDGEGWRHYSYEYSKLNPGEYVPWPFDQEDYEDELSEEFDNYYCPAGAEGEFVMGGEA